MKLNNGQIANLAERLESCQLEVRDTVKITDEHSDLDWEDAYAIQDEILKRKLGRGLRIIGLKAGLTSLAKMKQMGVSSPVFGFVTNDYLVQDGGEVQMNELIHPKVEPEIAFILNKSLTGPGCSIADVLNATAFVLPGIEVIDSRYKDFKFDLKSVVADNTSATRFVIGGIASPVKGIDLSTLGVILEKNGSSVAYGVGAAVLGNPATAVAMLANHLAERGKEIPAGTIVLSGGITEAVSVSKGDVLTLKVHGMGSTCIRFI